MFKWIPQQQPPQPPLPLYCGHCTDSPHHSLANDTSWFVCHRCLGALMVCTGSSLGIGLGFASIRPLTHAQCVIISRVLWVRVRAYAVPRALRTVCASVRVHVPMAQMQTRYPVRGTVPSRPCLPHPLN